MKINKKNTGLTLIEALIWFAIFAAVIAGVFSIYSSANDAKLASQTNKELSTIFSSVESLYATESTSGLTNIIGIQLGVFPKSMKIRNDETGIIDNSFGGQVALSGIAPSGFSLIYSKIPRGSICAELVRSQRKVGWEEVKIDGNSGVVKFNKTFDISNVAELCGTNGSGKSVLQFNRNNSLI